MGGRRIIREGMLVAITKERGRGGGDAFIPGYKSCGAGDSSWGSRALSPGRAMLLL